MSVGAPNSVAKLTEDPDMLSGTRDRINKIAGHRGFTFLSLGVFDECSGLPLNPNLVGMCRGGREEHATRADVASRQPAGCKRHARHSLSRSCPQLGDDGACLP